MADSQQRPKMREAIIALLEDALTWDEFERYYDNLPTQDRVIYDIGHYYWVCFAPEYPKEMTGKDY